MARAADWFANLSKKAQAEYIKAHPNSKYAKGAKAAKAPAKTSKPVAAIRQGVTHSMQASAHKRLEKTFKEAQTNLAREKRDLAKAKTPKTIAAAKARIRTLTSVVKHGKAAIAESKKKLDKLAKTKGSNSASKVTTMAMNGKAKKTVSAKAVKTAHDKKRATDKNKVIAKTPSSKTASMPKTMAKAIAQRKARIKSGATSLLKSATASLAEAKIKVKEAKTIKAKETAQRRVDSIKAKIAKLKAAAK